MKQITILLVLALAGCEAIIPQPSASSWQLEQARAVGPMLSTLAALAATTPQPGPTPPEPSPVPPLPEQDALIKQLTEERDREAAQVERVQNEWKADRQRIEKLTAEVEALKMKTADSPEFIAGLKENLAKLKATQAKRKTINAEVMPVPDGVLADGVHWLEGNKDARDQAATTGKPVLIWFTMRNCSWCDRVEEEVFSDADVANFINENFIALKARKEIQSAKTLRDWQVDGYPSFRAVRCDWTDWQKLDMSLRPSEWLASLDDVVAWNIAPRKSVAMGINGPLFSPPPSSMRPRYDDSSAMGSCSSGGSCGSSGYSSGGYSTNGMGWGFFGGGGSGGCASCQ